MWSPPPPSAGVGRIREESHFKFGEMNRLGSGGGTKPVNFFCGEKFSEIAKKKSGLRPENKGGPTFLLFLIFWLKKYIYYYFYYFVFENSRGLGTSARTSENGHMGYRVGVPL